MRLLVLAALALAAPAASAQEIVPFTSLGSGPWEAGLDLGMMVPTHRQSFSHIIDNRRAYDLLRGEDINEEIAEGWSPPPLPGYSRIVGSFKPMPDIALHAFYRLRPWLQWGGQLGYTFRQRLQIDEPGTFKPNNFFGMRWESDIFRLTFPAKMGPWIGRVRPYALLGPGAYVIRERVKINFTDPDDGQLPPLTILEQSMLRFGVHAGAGIEAKLGDRGSLGADLQYHKIFTHGDAFDMVSPSLRLNVLF